MNATLVDRAYSLHKQGSKPHRSESLATLAVEFPAASPTEIETAFNRAGSLIAAACQWAEELRGPSNDGTGTPSFNLKDRCPGFSDGTYSDAESWGLYLTK
jgi:hypothetical protein